MIQWKLLTGNSNPSLLREIKCQAFREGLKAQFDFGYPNFFYYKEDVYADEGLNKRFTNFLKKEQKKDKGFFQEIFTKEEKAMQELLAFSEEIKEQVEKKELKKESLLSTFKKYLSAFGNCTKFLLQNVIIGRILEENLEHALKKRESEKNKLQKDKAILCILKKETQTAEYNKKILIEAAKKEEQEEELNKKIIEQIQKEFSWVTLEDGYGNPLKKDDIATQIKQSKNTAEQTLKKLQEEQDAAQRETTKIIEEYKFTKEEQKEYHLLQKSIFYRAKINEELNKAGLNLTPFFKTVAKENNLTYEELFHVSLKEIQNIQSPASLSTNINKETLKQRMKNQAVLMQEGNIKIITDKQELEKINPKNTTHNKHELVGQCASPGKVKAKATVITNTTQLQEVKPGDVLVTKFTTPHYLQAMQKASAVITEVGGATSHGAVLARELGKPCIIGVQNATTSISSGDTLEIDAEKGTIKKTMQ